MADNIYRNFILNNSLAAISAVALDDITLATDGQECKIHEFDVAGNFNEYHCTARAYRRLRVNDQTCLTTALGCCNSAKVYFLSDRFRENDYVELDTSCEHNCGCVCGCEDFSELTDASITVVGNEELIVGAFRKSAYLFDMDGRRLTRLCTADDGEILTDFISLGNGIYAMGTLCGNTQTVTVSDNGNTQSAILSRGYTLRMLIPDGSEIYGLFGRNYIYNRIIKIYSNGILSLPRVEK